MKTHVYHKPTFLPCKTCLYNDLVLFLRLVDVAYLKKRRKRRHQRIWKCAWRVPFHFDFIAFFLRLANCLWLTCASWNKLLSNRHDQLLFYFTFIKITPIKRLETPEMILQRGQNLRSMLVILHTRVGWWLTNQSVIVQGSAGGLC